MFFDHEAVKTLLASIVSALSSATSVLLLVGVSQGDVTRLGAAVQQIGDGIASVISFFLLVISLTGTLYVFYKQTRHFWFKRGHDDPEIGHIEVLPDTQAALIAERLPGDKVRVANPSEYRR